MYSKALSHPALSGKELDGLLDLGVRYLEMGAHSQRGGDPCFTMTDLELLDLLLEGGALQRAMGQIPPRPGLTLIGLGPGDLGLMTKNAIDAAREADYRFLEGYTATLPPAQEDLLSGFLGDWTMLMRPEVEGPEEILELSGHSSVALLVVGDPLHATTHVDLLIRARERGIPTLVIPGISATSLAVTNSGLQSYRFGRQVTLPYPYGDYLPTSPMQMMLDNLSNNLHTLVLLDLDPTGMGKDRPIPMNPGQAVDVLQRMQNRIGSSDPPARPTGGHVLDWNCILLSDLGTSSQLIRSGCLREIANIQSGRIHCMIIPAEMDELEHAAFDAIRIQPSS